jgi:hypothetical protein
MSGDHNQYQKPTSKDSLQVEGEEHMRKPIAYIKYRDISFMRTVRNEGATGWHTNLGLAPKEGDAPLHEGREWVGLTDEEINAIQYSEDTRVDYVLYDEGDYGMDIDIFPEKFARAIEAKLKEKNT